LQEYLKGRYAFHLGGVGETGVGNLREAVRLDPEFALGWATLAIRALAAHTADDLPVSEEVRFAARKALELDDRLAEAHVVAGDIEFFANWNWARAEAEYRRALELNPSSGEAQLHFGVAMWALGRTELALEAARRTVELNPRGPVVNSGYGQLLRMAGRTSDALRQMRRSIEVAPSFSQNYTFLARVYEDMGQDQAAFEALMKAATLNGVPAETIEARRATYRAAGLAGVKRQMAEERLKALQARAAHTRVSPVAFAQAFAELGNKAEAFKWLEKAFEAKSVRLPFLAGDASFDPLRAEPEYAALLARMGLR
jgi:serine/threonine-protein kinase